MGALRPKYLLYGYMEPLGKISSRFWAEPQTVQTPSGLRLQDERFRVLIPNLLCIPIVSIVVPFFGSTNYILRIL